MSVAITRGLSGSLGRCELTHLGRQPIDIELAGKQHAAYESCLSETGYRLERLAADDQFPDAVFVEDTAVVLDELAVVTRPGARSRRGECAAVHDVLPRFRRVAAIQPPGTLDGGDVLVMDRRIWIGRTPRSNAEGRRQFESLVAPYGYEVRDIPVTGCLHLKSAVTMIASGVVLANPQWVDIGAFGAYERICVDEQEPQAANALCLDGVVVYPASFPRTGRRLADAGIDTVEVDVSELQKAEGGVTCCSILVR